MVFLGVREEKGLCVKRYYNTFLPTFKPEIPFCPNESSVAPAGEDGSMPPLSVSPILVGIPLLSVKRGAIYLRVFSCR